jgi:hypothetical protein
MSSALVIGRAAAVVLKKVRRFNIEIPFLLRRPRKCNRQQRQWASFLGCGREKESAAMDVPTQKSARRRAASF